MIYQAGKWISRLRCCTQCGRDTAPENVSYWEVSVYHYPDGTQQFGHPVCKNCGES